jgi:hypothetical protein
MAYMVRIKNHHVRLCLTLCIRVLILILQFFLVHITITTTITIIPITSSTPFAGQGYNIFWFLGWFRGIIFTLVPSIISSAISSITTKVITRLDRGFLFFFFYNYNFFFSYSQLFSIFELNLLFSFLKYSQTCLKRSPLGQRKSGFTRQMAS